MRPGGRVGPLLKARTSWRPVRIAFVKFFREVFLWMWSQELWSVARYDRITIVPRAADRDK